MSLKRIAHARRRENDAELPQLADDAEVAPPRVLPLKTKYSAISRGEPGTRDLATKQSELMMKNRDLDVLLIWCWTNSNESEHKRTNHPAQEQARYENYVRYMIPLDQQPGYLRAAGLEGIGVSWKRLENVIYGGRRSS